MGSRSGGRCNNEVSTRSLLAAFCVMVPSALRLSNPACVSEEGIRQLLVALERDGVEQQLGRDALDRYAENEMMRSFLEVHVPRGSFFIPLWRASLAAWPACSCLEVLVEVCLLWLLSEVTPTTVPAPSKAKQSRLDTAFPLVSLTP